MKDRRRRDGRRVRQRDGRDTKRERESKQHFHDLVPEESPGAARPTGCQVFSPLVSRHAVKWIITAEPNKRPQHLFNEAQRVGGSGSRRLSESEAQGVGGPASRRPGESEAQRVGGAGSRRLSESEAQRVGGPASRRPGESEAQRVGGAASRRPRYFHRRKDVREHLFKRCVEHWCCNYGS